MRFIFLIVTLFLLSCEKTDLNTYLYPKIQGELSWVKIFGGTDEDIAHAIIQTQDGGFAVFGNTKSNDGDITDKIYEGSDLWLLKFNADAELEWSKTYGGSGDDRGHSLVQTTDGGYMLLGYSKSSDGIASNNQGQHDNWIIRVDDLGVFMWERSFGFLGHDHAYNIIQTSDGGFLFNGFLDVTASNGAGNKADDKSSSRHGVGEFWCHKIDAQGALEWRNYFGGTSNDRSYDSVELENGNFVLVGTSESADVDITNPKGSYDIWVVTLDSKGQLLWEKSFGGTQVDRANAVLEDQNGNIVVFGNSFSSDGDISYSKGSSDFWIITLDFNGELLSEASFGGSDFDLGRGLTKGSGGFLWAAGYSRSKNGDVSQNNGDNDMLVLRISPDNIAVNSISFGGSGLDLAHDIIELSSGKIIVVGETESTDGIFTQNQGNKDLVIVQIH